MALSKYKWLAMQVDRYREAAERWEEQIDYLENSIDWIEVDGVGARADLIAFSRQVAERAAAIASSYEAELARAEKHEFALER